MKQEVEPLTANAERLARIEAQRRQRSLFALIRAIIRRSSADTVDDYKAHLNGRLDALTRLNAVVATEGRVDLALIVSEELLAQGAVEGEGVIIEGPPIKLRTDDSQTLGLAFHELATNAVKFRGGTSGVRIAVTWTSANGVLRLEWREECGVSQPAPPGPPGFGLQWLTETLPYELGADVDYSIGAAGIVCRMTIPPR